MKTKFIAFTLVVVIINTGIAHAVQNNGKLNFIGKQFDAIPCAGSELVIEKTDPVTVRFGEYSGYQSDNTIIVKNEGDGHTHTFNISEEDTKIGLFGLVENMRALNDLCMMNKKDLAFMSNTAKQILPTLAECGYGGGG